MEAMEEPNCNEVCSANPYEMQPQMLWCVCSYLHFMLLVNSEKGDDSSKEMAHLDSASVCLTNLRISFCLAVRLYYQAAGFGFIF